MSTKAETEPDRTSPLARARHDATEYRHAFHVSSFGRRRRVHDPAATQQLLTPRMTWSPQLKVLLEGVRERSSDNSNRGDIDTLSPLSLLYSYEDTLLRHIYQYHVSSWIDVVKLTNTSRKEEEVAFSPCARVRFPQPNDRSVNMLPFVLGDQESLPDDLKPYHDFIMNYCPLQDSELGKVLYLTVEEGWVEAGATQRRGGLHIESPRYTQFLESPSHTNGEWRGVPGRIGWGRGVLKNDEFIGGLFMASTVSKTCRVYHALVDKAAVDTHGGLDQLAQLIPWQKGYDMVANELVWMTDRTPHMVLPQEQREYRQFFRLVTSSLSIWNAVHNTPNPKCPLPEHVLVIHKSRFPDHKVPGSSA